MPQKLLFTEKQKFNQWWIWVILISANLINAIIVYQALQSNETNKVMIIVYFIALIVVLILFCLISLTTKITEKEIAIRFFPFHFKERKYLFSEIEKAEVIQYNPIMDYGGWGIRYGIKGKAFNIRGNRGLKLTFKTKRTLLIGTQNPEELKKIIHNIITRNEKTV